MALKYYTASNAVRTTVPKKAYENDYEAICENIFENAPNVFYNEVQYEVTYGKKDFKTIPMVRVDSVVNYNTGIQVGDDYKVFIFTPDFPDPYYGMKFKWRGNYWLVINTDNLGELSTSAEVRRCNNVLRFFDSDGNKIYEPCILDQTLRFTNNNDTSTIVTGKAEQYVWCQRNDRTITIKPNDRFLFGVPEQRIGFRLYAGGFGNSLNTVTGDNNSPTITQFYIEEYEINYELDDIIGGFANAQRYQFRIDVSNNSDTFNIGTTIALNAVVYNGDEVVAEPITWISSNPSVATITDGVLTTISEGETTITASMVDNVQVHNSITVTVQESPVEDKYDILINPDKKSILEGQTQIFDVSLYKNGVVQNDILNITDVSTGVPRNKYSLTADNNSFTLINKGVYMNEPVKIQCSCEHITKVFEITLRGLY